MKNRTDRERICKLKLRSHSSVAKRSEAKLPSLLVSCVCAANFFPRRIMSSINLYCEEGEKSQKKEKKKKKKKEAEKVKNRLCFTANSLKLSTVSWPGDAVFCFVECK